MESKPSWWTVSRANPLCLYRAHLHQQVVLLPNAAPHWPVTSCVLLGLHSFKYGRNPPHPSFPLAVIQRLHQHLLWFDCIIIHSAARQPRCCDCGLHTYSPHQLSCHPGSSMAGGGVCSQLGRRRAVSEGRRWLTRTKRRFPNDMLGCTSGVDTSVRRGPLSLQSLVRND